MEHVNNNHRNECVCVFHCSIVIDCVLNQAAVMGQHEHSRDFVVINDEVGWFHEVPIANGKWSRNGVCE
jgi:hypothetical protein